MCWVSTKAQQGEEVCVVLEYDQWGGAMCSHVEPETSINNLSQCPLPPCWKQFLPLSEFWAKTSFPEPPLVGTGCAFGAFQELNKDFFLPIASSVWKGARSSLTIDVPALAHPVTWLASPRCHPVGLWKDRLVGGIAMSGCRPLPFSNF